MFFKAFEDYYIESNEYVFLLGNHSHTDSWFPVNIPKLMPLISKDYCPGGNNVVYNNNIFINDTSCKPQTTNTLRSQNYLSVPRFANTNFGFKADKDGIIHHGAKFICQIMDKNIRDIHLTDSI